MDSRRISSHVALILECFLALVLSAGAAPARAALPPMSQEEIEAESDAVAVVDVLGVVCDELDGGVSRYTAWLQVVEVEKGTLRRKQTVLSHFTKIGRNAGGVNIELHPGQRVHVCLNQHTEFAETYNVWHQDGYRAVGGEKGELPTEPGEISFAPRRDRKTPEQRRGRRR